MASRVFCSADLPSSSPGRFWSKSRVPPVWKSSFWERTRRIIFFFSSVLIPVLVDLRLLVWRFLLLDVSRSFGAAVIFGVLDFVSFITVVFAFWEACLSMF